MLQASPRVGGLAQGLVLVAAIAGCKTGPDLSADYAQTARENYELALGEFGDEDWDETIQYADFVRIRFPFSRYAVEAELLIARAEFEQGNYLTSQDAFRQFAKLHPTHKHVRNGWVSYMAAVAAYMNGPQSFFLFPPDYQRDQSRLREALVELEYFFDHYGDTPSVKDAEALRDEINRRLLEHELYVARFYLEREKPEAAIGRLESAHAMYPGIGLDAEVLFLLGITYLRMEEVELARSTFSELQSQHPKHHHGKQAAVYLRYIYDTYGPADPSRKRPDRNPPVPLPPPEAKNRERPERPDLAPEGPESPEATPPPAEAITPGRRRPPPAPSETESEEGEAEEEAEPSNKAIKTPRPPAKETAAESEEGEAEEAEETEAEEAEVP
ncbi:MAG: outer membrane protein assembly factor BamD [Myxococcales bacterium]|nr:outer membrane protein assembly factor BamD [Myxococcales bacterium]